MQNKIRRAVFWSGIAILILLYVFCFHAAVAQAQPISSVTSPGSLLLCSTNPSAPTTLKFKKQCMLDDGSVYVGDSDGNAQQVAGSGTPTILTAGADGDDATTSNDSFLVLIDGTLSLVRGCANGQMPKWNETTDKWECGTLSLDECFDGGKIIDGANSQANAFRVGDGTDYWEQYIGPSGCEQACIVGGSPSDIITNIPSGKTYQIDLNGSSCITIDASGNVTLAEACEEKRRVKIPIGMCHVDGTNCTRNTDVTIGDLTYPSTVSCADNDASTIICMVPADPAWDEAELGVIMHGAQDDASPDGNYQADISMVCIGDNESLASITFGTEAASDFAASGYAEHDQIDLAEVTTVVTGCTAGDTVYVRYQVDATGTTAATPTDIHWIFMELVMDYNDWSN